MSFQGSGTGTITYQINNQQAVTNLSCSVDVLETDSAEMLTLLVGFTDSNLGQVQVGISVFNYNAATSQYNSSSYLMIGLEAENPQGGWASNTGSSVVLFITQTAGSSGKTYQGSFNADNLTWIGAGDEDSLAIKFGSFNLQVTQTAPPADSQFFTGAGSGSTTYTLDGGASQTENVTATVIEADNDGTLMFLQLNLTWSDPVKGDMQLILEVVGFTGSGDYSTADSNYVLIVQVWINAVSQTAYWQNGPASSVDFNVQYNPQTNGATLQATLDATGLVWQDSSQAALDLSATSLGLTLTLQPI
jgi:hypothetical protein